jgi:hypothetical protein
MEQRVYSSMYKDVPAITIENDNLKAQFTPELGGKMVSLIDKITGREFLRQNPHPTYKKLAYDGDYVASECSGFDDMFPNIDRGAYPSYPWKGAEMPDHGEVCGLAWRCSVTGDAICMSVFGVRFPYQLEKKIAFSDDRVLRIQYRATNLSAFDFDFLWAAHMMIDEGRSGAFMVPDQRPRPARIVFNSEDWLGGYGDIFSWPIAVDGAGVKRSISTVQRLEDRVRDLKFYFADKLEAGSCVYRYDDDGTQLTLSFPVEKLPYLGLLISRKNGVILEPCTATMDRPDMARLFKQNSVLPANGVYEWELNIAVSHRLR